MNTTRDLSAWEAEGHALLAKHKNFDLTTSEVHQLFDGCHVTEGEASAAFAVMSKAFAMGVASGRRMTEFDADETLSDLSVNINKARAIIYDLWQDYFSMQQVNVKQIECECNRISTFVQIADDYISAAQDQVNRLIG